MHSVRALAAATFLVFQFPAQAATLRPYVEIKTSTVHLNDLFANLGHTPDRILGPGPAAGDHIIVGAAQLAAIARDFNVDWRPATGTERIFIERRGEAVPLSSITAVLKTALEAAGAPEGSEITELGTQPIMVPSGSAPRLEITQCNYDVASSRFTALLSVAISDNPAIQMRLAGSVTILASAAVPTHRLPRGSVISASDIRVTRVRTSLLHGRPAISPQDAEGMVLKHDLAAGQPLTAMDVARPDLVSRGSLVRMTLISDGITLAAEGIARESGAEGARVQIENPTSHTVVEAEVIGPNSVRVAPRRADITLVAAQ